MKIADFIKSKRLKNLLRRREFIYVAIGDSAAQGIGASSLERSYPGIIYKYLKLHKKNVKFYNLGIRRSPTDKVIKDQLDSAIKLRPDLITVSTGANDIRLGRTPRKFKNDLNLLITNLKQNTDSIIAINSIPDATQSSWVPLLLKPLIKVWIKKFNSIIKNVSEKNNVVFVDLYSQTKIYANEFPEFISEDKLHPSDYGYAIWANSIITSLGSTLKLK